MRILLTGGAGYAGTVLAHQLLQEGHQVRVLDSLLHGGASLLSLYPQDGFEFMHGDIRGPETVRRALDGAEAVVHLAAIVGDPACKRQPELAHAVNVEASQLLHAESRREGVERFIFVSTCSNYGRMADPTQFVDEDAELRPVSLYAETKVAIEQELLARPQEPAVTVLRFATLFGVSPRMRFDLSVNHFTMEMMTTHALEVYGPHFWRPYLHVRDAARAIGLVLAQPAERVGGQVFNVGDTQENYTKEQLVSLICRELGGNVAVETVDLPDDPRDYRVSFERIRRELGFQITRTVPDGIREVIDLIRMEVLTDLNASSYRN